MRFERSLAEWAAGPFAPSREARTLAVNALTDTLACMIAGSVEDPTRNVARVVSQLGKGRATVIGGGSKAPAPQAALVNATAAHALDFDDNFAPAVTHASAVLVPALLALGEELGCSGADVVEAYLVGLELQARIGLLVNPAHYERGWHATSTIGTIGAAGGCARLLKLDADQTLAALSSASSMAAGSKKQFGSMMKPVHAGLAAHNAVLAARMAEAGVRGDPAPLTGSWSFADLQGGGVTDAAQEAKALEGLGGPLGIETAGLLPKRFPCCAAAHRTLDALVLLRERHEVRLADVDQIEAFIPAFARANLRFDAPRDSNEARFSLTYCGARVLDSGRLTLDDLTDARVDDPSIRPWLGRFTINIKPGSVTEELGDNATPALTRLHMTGGRTFEVAVAYPKGSRRLPFNDQDRFQKMLDCCAWANRPAQAGTVLDTARMIDSARPLAGLSRILGGEPGR